MMAKQMVFVRIIKGFTNFWFRYCWCTWPKLLLPQWLYVGMKEESCCITAVQERPTLTPQLNSKALQLNPLGVFGFWRNSIGILRVEIAYTCIHFFSTVQFHFYWPKLLNAWAIQAARDRSSSVSSSRDLLESAFAIQIWSRNIGLKIGILDRREPLMYQWWHLWWEGA